MKLYGKKDERHGDMGDFTGYCLIPIDFNTIATFLESGELKRCFSVCEDSFSNILKFF